MGVGALSQRARCKQSSLQYHAQRQLCVWWRPNDFSKYCDRPAAFLQHASRVSAQHMSQFLKVGTAQPQSRYCGVGTDQKSNTELVGHAVQARTRGVASMLYTKDLAVCRVCWPGRACRSSLSAHFVSNACCLTMVSKPCCLLLSHGTRAALLQLLDIQLWAGALAWCPQSGV